MTDQPLTYAKADGPPDDWMLLKVIDADTGEEITDVVEVNTAEGWLVRYVIDPETGSPVLEGEGDDLRIKTERVERATRLHRKETH